MMQPSFLHLLPVLVLLPLAVANVGSSPSNLSVCDAARLSAPCRSFTMGRASKPSALCCRRLVLAIRSPYPKCVCSILRGGGASVAVNETQALALAAACKHPPHPVRRCFDGSGTTKSPTKQPKAIPPSSAHAPDAHALDTDGICPGCGEGSIDPGSLIPIPPS